MKNQFNLNIKTPCSENFNQFSPTSNGGFCDSCEKEVIDFTKMNAQDIINYFKTKKTQDTCGKFKSNQLKTYTEKRQKNKRISLLSGIGLACLSLFSFGTIQGQVIKTTTEVKTSAIENTFLVKGNVSDEISPLPGVNILLQGTTIGTQTDFNGNFEFPKKLKKGDVLVFSYVGLESQKIVINNKNSATNIALKIDMIIDDIIIMGKVAVKKAYTSKKN